MGEETDNDAEQQMQQEYSQILSHSQVRAGNQSFASQNPFNNQSSSPYDAGTTSNNLTNIFAGDSRMLQGGTDGGRASSTGVRSNITVIQQNNNFLISQAGTNNNNQRSYGLIDSSDFEKEDEEDDDEEEHDDDWDGSQDESRRSSSQREAERNFVETLVDDILARNHQYNQLQAAYNLASLQQQHQQQIQQLTHQRQTENSQEESNYGFNTRFLRDTFDLIDRQREDSQREFDEIYRQQRANSHYIQNDMNHAEDDSEHYYYEVEEDEAQQSEEDHEEEVEPQPHHVVAIRQDNNQEEIVFGDEIEEIDEEGEEDGDDDDEDYKDDEETELERYLRDVNGHARCRTAPLKAQKHVEQFKMTPGFQQLEQAAVCAVQLVQRGDMKFDLDSYEGQNSCKKFLSHLEKMCESLEVKCSARSYRKKFSNAYKVLYKEGKLCYLTEILDSAQEGKSITLLNSLAFPYLWVNGEKYVFSKEVIDAGRNLFNNFCKVLYLIKDSYQRICEENTYEGIMDVMNEIRENLEEFDVNWVTYEQLYVVELMLIESDARRFITEAIELEKEITSAEVRERAKGKIMVDCPDYNKNRTKLVDIINKINAVANPEGKGRDDLQAEILFQAEGICRRVSSSQSKAVRKLAEAIRKSFTGLRTLLRKYEENIEGVDPQLKNNADLVQALVEFEQSWEKGKTYFVNPQKCNQLIHFTSMVEGTAEKYKSFQEQIDDRDTVIFVTIPALLILKNLDDDDKGICKLFFPPMFGEENKEQSKEHHEEEKDTSAVAKHQELKKDYVQHREKARNQYDFYNLVEKSVLEMEGEESNRFNEDQLKDNDISREELQKIVQQIRLLSMQLQRHKPVDWNEFLDVALDN